MILQLPVFLLFKLFNAYFSMHESDNVIAILMYIKVTSLALIFFPKLKLLANFFHFLTYLDCFFKAIISQDVYFPQKYGTILDKK